MNLKKNWKCVYG